MNKKAFPLLMMATTSIMIGYGLFIPLIPAIISNYHVNITIASLTLSIYGLGQFISSPLIGSIADSFGAKKTLVFGMLGYVITLTISLLQTNLIFLIISRIGSGIFAGSGIASMNYIAKYASKKEQSYYFTYVSLAIAVGMIIGPLLGFVYLASKMLAISIILCMGLLLTLVIAYRLEDDQIAIKSEEYNLFNVFKEIQIASKLNTNRFILIVSFLFGLICSGLEAVCLTYLLVYFKFSQINLLIIAITSSLLIFYVLAISPKLIADNDNYILCKKLLLMTAIGFSLLTITKFDFLMIFGLIIIIGSLATLITTLATFITTTNKQPGLMFGARNSIISIGAVAGPIIISQLYIIQPHIAMVGFAIFTLLAMYFGMVTVEEN